MFSASKTAEAIGQTKPHNPTWLESRHLIVAGGLLAVIALVLAVTFIQFEREKQRTGARVELHRLAKAIENHTAASLGAVEAMLLVLSNSERGLMDPKAPGRIDSMFAGVVRGFPQLRSVSVLDEGGRVVASTTAGNLDKTIDLAVLGPPSTNDSKVILGPVLNGRDLADLQRPGVGLSMLNVLPMLAPLTPSSGQRMRLVALINLDYFGSQYETTTNDPTVRVALTDFEGRLLAATSNVMRASGSSLAHLRAFSEFLPQRESGTYLGPGIDDPYAIAAFSALRQWPMVLMVETSYADAMKEVTLIERWVLLLVLATWFAIAVLTYITSRSLKRHAMISTQLNREVYDSEARNNAFLESSLDGVITIDFDGVIVAFNPAAERIFGRTRADCIGKVMDTLLVPPSLQQAHHDGIKKYTQSRDGPALNRLNRRIETVALHADGTLFPIELSIVSLQVEDVLLFTASIRNISEQKKDAQERLELLRKYHAAATDLEQQNAELMSAECALKEARTRELEVGNRIQQSLLGASPEYQLPGLWFSHYNQASKGIDGDFIDVIKLGGRCVDFIVGDVMGKGVPAALLGAATKLQFSRSLAELLASAGQDGEVPQPSAIVSSVHQAMTPHLQALDSFVTLTYIRIDLERKIITWVGCGHEEALLIHSNGNSTLLPNQQPPMGILDHNNCTQSEIAMAQSDALFLCSDGLSDAIGPDGERLGHDIVNTTLQKILHEHATPAVILHALRRELLGSTVQITDDVTMALIMQPDDGATDSRCELPPDLKMIRPLRQFLASQATHVGLSEHDVAMIEVAGVEVFTNIVRHAKGLLAGAPVELIARSTAHEFVLDIIHLGDEFIPSEIQSETDFSAFPEGGFGLTIIRNACDRVDYLHYKGVNTVRMIHHLDN